MPDARVRCSPPVPGPLRLRVELVEAVSSAMVAGTQENLAPRTADARTLQPRRGWSRESVEVDATHLGIVLLVYVSLGWEWGTLPALQWRRRHLYEWWWWPGPFARTCHWSGFAGCRAGAADHRRIEHTDAAQQSNFIAEKAQWSIGANDGRARNARHRAERHRTGTRSRASEMKAPAGSNGRRRQLHTRTSQPSRQSSLASTMERLEAGPTKRKLAGWDRRSAC